MNNANLLFQQAVERLNYFNEELNRPEEDVVTFSICHQTRGIIADLLGSYLLNHGKEYPTSLNLDSLLKLCSEFDAGMMTLNISAMDCHPGNLSAEKTYCLDIDQVKFCINIANKLKEIVRGKMALA